MIYYIGLGGNIGDVARNMQLAINKLSNIGIIQKLSSLYCTKPWGYEHQANFLNSCLTFKTEFLPEKMLAYCQMIEASLGRVRSKKWGPRLIDIDILFCLPISYYKSKNLCLPHPYMLKRAFVLVPLYEIAPDLQIKNKTIKFYINRLKNEELDKILLDKTNKTWNTTTGM